MAARGAGAALSGAAIVLGLTLLWAGPAGARVHHLTLKVRSAPLPFLYARPRPRWAPPGSAEGSGEAAWACPFPAGPGSSLLPAPSASSRCLPLALLPFRCFLGSPSAPQPARAQLCFVFPVIYLCVIPLAPSLPVWPPIRRGENAWRGLRSGAV